MEADARLRMLRVLELLYRQTDELHALTLAEIAAQLRERWEIETYRITLQKDIAALIEAGVGIEIRRARQNKYYLSIRTFELPELQLLIDAIQSSRFITERKSEELIRKLTTFCSTHQIEQLRGHLPVEAKLKARNERIYYIIDTINEAIGAGRKISFQYFAYGGGKQKVLKNNGQPYVFSPYSLVWSGAFYYAIGWSDKHGKIAVFRVDRIVSTPKLLRVKAVPVPADYDAARFAERAFKLFAGETERVTLRCENSAMNTIIDHFGEEVQIRPCDGTHFLLSVEVTLAPPFFAWLFEFGGQIELLGSERARRHYARHLAQAAAVLPDENR